MNYELAQLKAIISQTTRLTKNEAVSVTVHGY